MKALNKFREKLYSCWLPEFCHAPHRRLKPSGFKDNSITNLTEFDARWFLLALEQKLVVAADGFFSAPCSNAREQIFWTGRKDVTPRPLTLWLEPVITIGALARLVTLYGWPIDRLGMQSKNLAFDLMAYKSNLMDAVVACEVKKTVRETTQLIHLVSQFGQASFDAPEPVNSKARNIYRKAKAISDEKPALFWALGPEEVGGLFVIKPLSSADQFELVPCDGSMLNFERHRGAR